MTHRQTSSAIGRMTRGAWGWLRSASQFRVRLTPGSGSCVHWQTRVNATQVRCARCGAYLRRRDAASQQ